MKSICRLLAVLFILAAVLSACSAGQPEQTLQQAYTVTVTDAEGNPISGVMVQLCLDACYPGVTDADGRAEFPLPEADYKVSLLTVPEGYTYSADTQEFHFEPGSKSLCIVLSGNG